MIFILAILVVIALIALSNCLKNERTYPATLNRQNEESLVYSLITDMQAHPDHWEIGIHYMENGKIKIWIANEPYADMKIEAPFRVDLSSWGANRLREQKRKMIEQRILKIDLSSCK